MIDVKVGDVVVRNMCGIEMDLPVTEVTKDLITCGGWTFDPKTGHEIDDCIPDVRSGYIISTIRKKEHA